MPAILDVILGTKTGEAMRAEAERKHRDRREALSRQLDAHNALAESQRRPLVDRHAAAGREVATAEKALAAARAKAHSTRLLLAQHDQRVERERVGRERELLECAGPELEAFLQKVRDEQTRLMDWRRIQERREIRTIGYSVSTGPIQQIGTTDNREEISARINALSEAAHEAHRLASTQADFADEIDRLWNNLPEENAR